MPALLLVFPQQLMQVEMASCLKRPLLVSRVPTGLWMALMQTALLSSIWVSHKMGL